MVKSESPEVVVKKLRQTIDNLKTNLAVSEHNMNEAMEKLKMDYGIESIEEGIETVGRIDKELREREEALNQIAVEISTAMENYING